MNEARRRDFAELVGLDDIPGTIKARELGELIGVGTRQIDTLNNHGIVIRLGRGDYDTRESIINVIQSLRKRGNAELDAERVRLTREQADKVELANQAARGELVPASEIEHAWASILRDVRAGMLALPSRLQQRLPHLTPHDVETIDAEIRAALVSLSDE